MTIHGRQANHASQNSRLETHQCLFASNPLNCTATRRSPHEPSSNSPAALRPSSGRTDRANRTSRTLCAGCWASNPICLLRGKKTEDMIFSGSEHRPRAGMASAEIVFDNSANWLPVDFAEVAVTRRAYRDGHNEYLLNGQHVRLRDMNELLAASGLSERTYTILGQGLVDASLALKADERRRLFEEAAGVGLYRVRREEALKRLENTQRNLERVQDIMAELEPRLKTLERQARGQTNMEAPRQICGLCCASGTAITGIRPSESLRSAGQREQGWKRAAVAEARARLTSRSRKSTASSGSGSMSCGRGSMPGRGNPQTCIPGENR